MRVPSAARTSRHPRIRAIAPEIRPFRNRYLYANVPSAARPGAPV